MPIDPQFLKSEIEKCEKEPSTASLNYMIAVHNNHRYSAFMNPKRVLGMTMEVFTRDLIAKRKNRSFSYKEIFRQVLRLHPIMAKVETAESIVREVMEKYSNSTEANYHTE